MANKQRILIGCPTYGQNDARFTVTMFMLAKFPGTELMQVRRSPVDVARNALMEYALKNGHDYLFMIDDDMAIEEGHPAGMLDALIQEMEKDKDLGVIAPRAYKRTTPFYPCVFKKRTDGNYDPIDAVDKGLVDVDAIHCAVTLLRPSILEKVPKPWFSFERVNGALFSEDIAFTRKLKDAGVKMRCHTDIQVQHISDPILVDRKAYETYKQ